MQENVNARKPIPLKQLAILVSEITGTSCEHAERAVRRLCYRNVLIASPAEFGVGLVLGPTSTLNHVTGEALINDAERRLDDAHK